MKVKIKIIKEVEVKILIADIGVRYWEDALVNYKEDTLGDLIPCRFGDRWRIVIDVEEGIILNWKKGVIADVHYKVCDDGNYYLLDKNDKDIVSKEGYVPKILDLYNQSFGDYVILKIDENGRIAKWNKEASLDDFEQKEQ